MHEINANNALSLQMLCTIKCIYMSPIHHKIKIEMTSQGNTNKKNGINVGLLYVAYES